MGSCISPSPARDVCEDPAFPRLYVASAQSPHPDGGDCLNPRQPPLRTCASVGLDESQISSPGSSHHYLASPRQPARPPALPPGVRIPPLHLSPCWKGFGRWQSGFSVSPDP
eukprot:GGOE01029326.1.p5 GENE.GGOE01029326.1~~GGOE01029326.1.p5  ORF type:complete len:112 (-),score=5.00 GGOE01029326.1:1316-1651(-)